MKQHVWVAVCGLLLPICLLNSLRTISGQTSSPRYKDPSLPIEKRTDDLVSQMTLEEKVSQMMNAAPAIPRLDIPAYDFRRKSVQCARRKNFPLKSVLRNSARDL